MASLRAGVLAEPVLVGRERELEELTICLNSAAEGRGTTVFVSGEAGAGKTRVVKEFLANVKEKEVAVLSGWCLSDFSVPYLPFKEAFSAYFSTTSKQKQTFSKRQQPGSDAETKMAEQGADEEEEIGAWLAGPTQSKKLQGLTPQGWQDLAVAAVTKTLVSISERKTTILFIDDIQWADSASLSLLHYIARSANSARILVLGTYRSEELTPDAEGHPHPLLETLRMMRRENVLKEIILSSLNPVSIAALAEKMVGGELHPEFMNRLAEDSHGNPLYVVESLRMFSEDGSLFQDSGRWQLIIDEVGIPDKIKDIILRRVDKLRPNQRRILGIASVIGEKFDLELLSAVSGMDILDLLEELNVIAQSSFLLRNEAGHYEFDHARSREAIYEAISGPLRKGYHSRIAERMEAASMNVKDLPANDLAYHYAQAGNTEKAVKYSLISGEDSLSRFSNSEAARLFAYVLAAVVNDPEHAEERTIAVEGLGDALCANGLYSEASKKFELLSSVTESGVVKLRALRKAMLCFYWMSDWEHALELGEKAEQYAQFDRLEYARFRACRGFVAGRMAKTVKAFEDVESALRVFEEELSLRDLATALTELVLLYLDEDRVEDELITGLRSLALYCDLEDLRGQLNAHIRLAFCFGLARLLEKGRYNIEEAINIAQKVGDYSTLAMEFGSKSAFIERTGDIRTAIAENLKGVEYAQKTESRFALSQCYMNLIREYSMLGEIEHAEEFAKRIDKMVDEFGGLSSDKAFFGIARYSKAFLFAAKGQWKEANEIFETFKPFNVYGSAFNAQWKEQYAWALAKQGRNEEARMQLETASRMRQKVEEKAERLEHANIHGFLMAQREIGAAEEFNVRLDIVNVAKNPATLLRVEGLIPPEFKATSLPSNCNMQDCSILLNRKELGSFDVETLKLRLQATKAGAFIFDPDVVYVDDVGKTKTCKIRPITVTVRPMLHYKVGEETINVPVLPGRVPTGSTELDIMLYGGIPEKYAVALTSPPTDERALLMNRFLEAGAKAGETTFYVTVESGVPQALAQSHQSNFYILICNPQVDAMVENLPNVLKLKGTENLTEIDIALTKAFRMIKPLASGPRRICIDIVSDVLLQHHAVTTRKWLNALLPNLKHEGFTIIAIVNPGMHAHEEVQAILGLFDGEIDITEKGTVTGPQQVLKIRRLVNQKYLEKEIVLAKQRPYR